MTPNLWDHALVVVLLVVAPIGGWYSYRQLSTQAPLDARARLRWYARVIAQQCGLTLVAVALWLAAGRSLALLGLGLPLDFRSLLGAGLTAAGLGLLYVQWRSFGRATAADRAGIREQLVGAEALIPRSDPEHRRFRAMAVTAGICEETLYRGFLITYLAVFVGGWMGLAVASVLFGLAHIYQGAAGALKTGTVGLVMGLLFVLSGSLLWGMVLHAVTDLQGGAIARRVLGDLPVAPAEAAPAG